MDRKKRLRPAVALTSGTSAQLIVDSAGIVALGADYIKSSPALTFSASGAISALCFSSRSAKVLREGKDFLVVGFIVACGVV